MTYAGTGWLDAIVIPTIIVGGLLVAALWRYR